MTELRRILTGDISSSACSGQQQQQPPTPHADSGSPLLFPSAGVRLPNPFAGFGRSVDLHAAPAAAAAPDQATPRGGASAPIDWGSAFRAAARGFAPQVSQQVRGCRGYPFGPAVIALLVAASGWKAMTRGRRLPLEGKPHAKESASLRYMHLICCMLTSYCNKWCLLWYCDGASPRKGWHRKCRARSGTAFLAVQCRYQGKVRKQEVCRRLTKLYIAVQ